MWDGFHVYVETKLKSYYSFKKRYSMSNMGLVGYNKRFLNASVSAPPPPPPPPGSTHDARLLRSAPLFNEIVNGQTLPQCTFDLGDLGEIPLLTIGDSAFPRYPWLVKAYNENLQLTPQEKHFNKTLCSARAIVEDCYGMLNGRWRILYKKTECRLNNLKYIIMACINLHNFCIETKDPCNPRWILEVKELDLHEKETVREGNKNEADLVRNRISNWLGSRKL